MLAVYCDELNKQVMLDLNSVAGLEGEDGCLTLSYQCLCGQRGRLLTGRDRSPRSGHLVV